MKNKICIYCKEAKPLTEFYLMKNGYYRGECRNCQKIIAQKNRYKNIEYYKEYDRNRAKQKNKYYQKNREKFSECSKRNHIKLMTENPNYGKEKYEKNKDYHSKYDKKRNKDPIYRIKKAKYLKEYNLKNGIITGTGQSIPEKQVEQILVKSGLRHEKEKSFDNCRNREGNLLFFDFHIPYFKLAIEVDGIYHTNPIFGQDILNKMKEHDKVKTQYCKDNNILLLRIPYEDFNKIKQILKDYLIQLKQAA